MGGIRDDLGVQGGEIGEFPLRTDEAAQFHGELLAVEVFGKIEQMRLTQPSNVTPSLPLFIDEESVKIVMEYMGSTGKDITNRIGLI